MGVRFGSVSTIVNVGVLPATGAETVIMTTPPLTLPLDSAQIFLFWYFLGNTGASTTVLTWRLRRGTTTGGTLINSGNGVGVTAAVNATLSGCYNDTPGAVAGQQYSWTLQGTSTAGAGTFLEGCMTAMVL